MGIRHDDAELLIMTLLLSDLLTHSEYSGILRHKRVSSLPGRSHEASDSKLEIPPYLWYGMIMNIWYSVNQLQLTIRIHWSTLSTCQNRCQRYMPTINYQQRINKHFTSVSESSSWTLYLRFVKYRFLPVFFFSIEFFVLFELIINLPIHNRNIPPVFN